MNQLLAMWRTCGVPRMSSSITPPPTDEFDYGTYDRAFMFPTFKDTPDAPKKSDAYINKLLSWYTCFSRPCEEVWSLKRIINCPSVDQMDIFMGSINNVLITVERKDGKAYKFTIADIPHMNFADVISLILAWSGIEINHIRWARNYLKHYAFYFYIDLTRVDYELARLIHSNVADPDYELDAHEQKKNYGFGEIVMNGNDVKVIYDGLCEKTGEMCKRALVMKQIHLYPSYVIESTLARTKLTPFRINKVKTDVISRMEWILEFRRNMLLVPELCFEEKVIPLREKNKEIHQRKEAAQKQANQ